MTIVQGDVYREESHVAMRDSLDITAQELFNQMSSKSQQRLLSHSKNTDSHKGDLTEDEFDVDKFCRENGVEFDEAVRDDGAQRLLLRVLEERDEMYMITNHGIEIKVVELIE